MKKIIMISHSSAGGGAEAVFLKTYHSLMPHCKLSVFMPDDKGVLYDEIIKSGGDIYVGSNKLLEGGGGKNFLKFIVYNLKSLFYICYLVFYKKIEVVYSSSIINYIGALVAIVMGKKHVWHIHEMNNPGHVWVDKKYKFIFRFLLKRSKVIFVSNGAKESWLNFFNMTTSDISCFVIYNPIKDIPILKRAPRTEIKIGFAGTYNSNKNLSSFVNVMVDIINDYDNIEMHLAGNGIERNVELLINGRLGLNKYVLSDHIDIDKFMNDIDILVLPSFSESWGLVVFEAMSVGVIPIVTSATSLQEVLIDGVNVFYVDPRSENDIYIKIKNVLDDFDGNRSFISNNNFKFLSENNFNVDFNEKIVKVLSEY